MIIRREPSAMLRRTAGFGLSIAAIVLALVALLVGSPGLFYMFTALIATLATGRLQAWLAVLGLRVERSAPAVARVGELVTVEVGVWSERRIRRPLVTIEDDLPRALIGKTRSPSLPIAPAFDEKMVSQYQFRPPRRGRYVWRGLQVVGSDALGLTTVVKHYDTEPAELLVVPIPIPISIELPTAGGVGISEAGSGQARGGVEPRGVREFAPGDSFRHVHWRSTARLGTLLVKDFEAGSQARYAVLLQRAKGSDLGRGALTSLDLACGQALTLADALARAGGDVLFPQFEDPARRSRGAARRAEIESLLATAAADGAATLAADLRAAASSPAAPSVLVPFITVLDPEFPSAVRDAVRRRRQVTVVLYDAAAFGAAPGASPTRPDYMDELEAAGAKTAVIPVANYLTEARAHR